MVNMKREEAFTISNDDLRKLDMPLVSHHKSKRDNWLGLLLFAS
jgi:hypothetical protein